MEYDVKKACTTYIVVSGEQEHYVERAKFRLDHIFPPEPSLSSTMVKAEDDDPFLLHSILCHESLLDGKPTITNLRYRLYDELDVVGEYAKEPFARSDLKNMTNRLHMISQDADSLIASTEMGTMASQLMVRARDRAVQVCPDLFSNSTVGDALMCILDSLQAQKRWLASYKSRKDMAMSLVFNLVTQQDSETNTDIARDTKDDSASMKIIAVMTMLFLPTTAASGVFSMCFFTIRNNNLDVSNQIWLFVAIVLPLTLLIISLWWTWYLIEFSLRAIWHAIPLKSKFLQMGKRSRWPDSGGSLPEAEPSTDN
jgi:hypothetical protein